MNAATISFAFTAGMVAAFNPCGVVILPSYIAYLLGYDRSRSGEMGWVRALVAGLLMTGGFIFIFTAAGLLFSLAGRVIAGLVPWLAVFIGAGLIVLGLGFLRGWQPGTGWLSRATGRLQGPTRAGGWRGLFAYGVAYGIISLSCTLPVFIAVTVQAFMAGTVLGGVILFLAYAAGMGTVVTTVSLLAVLAGDWLSRHLREALPVVKQVSGLIIIAAGVYIVYYWLFGPGGLL